MGQEIIAKPSGRQAQPILERSTTTGTIAAGAITVSFMNVGAADATVAGGTLAAGESVTFPELINKVYQSIAYVATGTTLVIAQSR